MAAIVSSLASKIPSSAPTLANPYRAVGGVDQDLAAKASGRGDYVPDGPKRYCRIVASALAAASAIVA
jgi:hypothetical protein